MTDMREDSVPEERQKAGGVVLNDQYQEITHTQTEDQGMTRLDLHEFTVLPHGMSALASANHLAEGDGSDIGQGPRPLVDYGFEEIDLETGKALFDWWPRDHGIGLSESMDTEGMDVAQSESTWDWFHLNSVDKNEAGDYLISGRHTSTVYKVSGKDVSVSGVWPCIFAADFDTTGFNPMAARWSKFRLHSRRGRPLRMATPRPLPLRKRDIHYHLRLRQRWR